MFSILTLFSRLSFNFTILIFFITLKIIQNIIFLLAFPSGVETPT